MDERQHEIRQYRKTINELEGHLLELYRELGRTCLSAAEVPPELALWRNELDAVKREREELASRRRLIEQTRECLERNRIEALNLHGAVRTRAKALAELHSRLGTALLDAAPDLEIPALQAPMLKLRSLRDEKDRLSGVRADLDREKATASLPRRVGVFVKAFTLSLARARLESKLKIACAECGASAAANPVLLECGDTAVGMAQEAILRHNEESAQLRQRLELLETERKSALSILSDANAAESPRRALLELDALDQAAQVREDRIYSDCAQELVRLSDSRRKKRSPELTAFLRDPAHEALLKDRKQATRALAESDTALQKAHTDERIRQLREELAAMERQAADHKRRIAASELALRDLERQSERLRTELSELGGGGA